MLETPNRRHIRRFLSNLRQRYRYEKLRKWPLEKLEGEEWQVEIEFLKFRRSFPPQAPVLQGTLRQYTTDDVNNDEESLTEAEWLVLNQAKQEIVGEINAALGEKSEENPETNSSIN